MPESKSGALPLGDGAIYFILQAITVRPEVDTLDFHNLQERRVLASQYARLLTVLTNGTDEGT